MIADRPHSLFRRTLAAGLAAWLFFGPLLEPIARAEGENLETFNFADMAPAPGGPGVGSAPQKSADRNIPVGPDGAFTHTIPIQIPPSRLGMAPHLALVYSSATSRSGGIAGAGWSFAVSPVERDLSDGVRLDATGHYATRRFLAPAGRIVAATGVSASIRGPTSATGEIFVPEREREPVRYEFRAELDAWIEHHPSGRKKYFGAHGAASARIVNPLGTYAWLLIREEDAFGNVIDYEYHPQSAPNETTPAPIISRVRWGANPRAGLLHKYEVRTEIEPRLQREIDMLHGRVELRSRLLVVSVGPSDGSTAYWSYDLEYEPSPDSGRDLLNRLIRRAPGEADQITTFSYSNNEALVGSPRFAPPLPLPAGVYADATPYFEETFPSPEEAKLAARSPLHLRSAHKWVDFDADAKPDIVYHPAGLGPQGSRIRVDLSLEQATGALQPWSHADLHDIPATAEFSAIGDLDRDRDLDAIGFEGIEVRGYVRAGTDSCGGPAGLPTEPGPAGGLPAEFMCEASFVCGTMCGNPAYHDRCGMVDPPPFSEPLPYPGGPLGWDPTHYRPFDEIGWRGPPGYVPAPSMFQGADGFFYEEPGPGEPFIPFCGCIPMCHDASCDLQSTPEPTAPSEDNGLGVATESPSAWIALNQSIAGGRVGLQQVQFWHWPPGVRERFQLGYWVGNRAKSHPVTVFQAPSADVDGDGRDDLLLLKYKSYLTPVGVATENPITTFSPRAYLLRGQHFVSDLAGPHLPGDEPYTGFSSSLIAALAPGMPDGCAEELGCLLDTLRYPTPASDREACANNLAACLAGSRYPAGVDFNAMPLDVNGDRLVDLVVAEPPSEDASGLRTCVEGHRVYLNLGDRWNVWNTTAERAIADETWSSQNTSDALGRLRNRNPFCPGGGPGSNIAPEPLALENIPVGAASFVDLNADGRLDLVFAYTNAATGEDSRSVHLNTGSGFRVPSPLFAPVYADSNIFPTALSFAILKRRLGIVTPRVPELWTDDASDVGRLTDVDGDGLVDAVIKGRCDPSRPCSSATWRRNLGVHPDLLTGIAESSGTSVAIHYLWSGSEQARASGLVLSGHLTPANVVARIDRAAGPAPTYPVETITMSYRDERTTLVEREALGFEQVTAVFQNRFDGADREALRVTQTYDVRSSLPGAALAIEHPLRGLPITSEVESNGWIKRTRYTWVAEPLGTAALRIREDCTELEECFAGRCRAKRTEVSNRDSFGFATEQIEGPVQSGALLASQTRRTALTHDVDPSLWILGRPTSESLYGVSANIDGDFSLNVRLSERRWRYSGPAVESEARVEITPASCAGTPSDDEIQYEYRASGQIARIIRGNRIVTQEYDENDFFLTLRSVDVSQFWDGQSIGSTALDEKYEYDPRTGAVISYRNAADDSWTAQFDSRGRPLLLTAPNGEILSELTYQDDYPAYVDEIVHVSPTQRFTRRRHLDGSGRSRAIIESGAGVHIRKTLARRDAFGRSVEEYLPAFVANLDDTSIPPGAAFVRQSYDGFDRPVLEVRPDGTNRRWTYEVGATHETNPRGYLVFRRFYWDDLLAQVVFYDGGTTGSAVAAQQWYTYDSLGRLLAIEDADNHIRRFERDAAGRIHRLTLPHPLSVDAPAFEICSDHDGALLTLETPAGRSVSIVRDEIGRVIESSAAYRGRVVVTQQSYDAWPDAFGRLARVVDGSGTVEMHYDQFGRRAAVDVEPTTSVASIPGQPYRYSVEMGFANHGQLVLATLTAFSTLGAIDLGTVRHTYDDFGRALSVISDGVGGTTPLVSSPTFEPDGILQSALLGSGVTARWTHDPLSRRLREIVYATGSAPVARVSYSSIDPNGNIEQELRYKDTSVPLTQKRHRYDALDRLEWSELITPAGGTQASEYTYSPAGNLLLTSSDKYFYDDPINVEAATYLVTPSAERGLSYDLDGWLEYESRNNLATGTVEKRDLFYDGTGCLAEVATKVHDAAGNVVADRLTEHICGPSQTRVLRSTKDLLTGAVQRVLEIPGVGEVRPDDGIILRRIGINSTVVVEEARDLSSGARVAAESGYVLQDARGSVLAKTTLSAPGTTLTREAEYDVWGTPIALGTLPPPRHGFVGAEADPGDGYLHFGRRVYEPTLRRWLSPDPLILGQPELDLADGRQLNLYAYAANNPATHVDPNGQIVPILVILATKVGMSAASGGVAAVVISAGIGFVDPNPAGSIDIPGPADEAGRAAKLGLKAGASLAANVASDVGQMAAKAGNDIAGAAGKLADDAKALFKAGDQAADEAAKISPSGTKDIGKLTNTNPTAGINSLREKIMEHQQKIADYLKNPDAFDNENLLKNAATPEIRQKIIEGRVKHLQKEISNFEKNIQDLGGTP